MIQNYTDLNADRSEQPRYFVPVSNVGTTLALSLARLVMNQDEPPVFVGFQTGATYYRAALEGGAWSWSKEVTKPVYRAFMEYDGDLATEPLLAAVEPAYTISDDCLADWSRAIERQAIKHHWPDQPADDGTYFPDED